MWSDAPSCRAERPEAGSASYAHLQARGPRSQWRPFDRSDVYNLVRVFANLIRNIVKAHEMRRIGIYEVRTHFSEVIDKVVEGETIVITRHGCPVARIVPEPGDRAAVHALIDDWFEHRRKAGLSLGDLTIRELIDEGKR